MKNQENVSFDSLNLIAFLYSKRKILAIVGSIAAVVSLVVSMLITPKFKSTVVMFPTTTSSISKSLLSQNPSAKQDIMALGEEEQAEQMLQVLNSDEIRNKIISKYDLMNHYEIDPNDKYKLTKLNNEFESNITFKRTEFMSVRVDVLDKDPKIAADIANEIAAMVDTVKNRMLKERSMQGYQIVKAEYDNMKNYIKAKEDSMQAIMRLGVFDFESQSEMLYEQMAIATAKGDSRAMSQIQEKLDVLAKYGSTYISIRESLLNERKLLAELKAKHDEAKVDAEQNITHKFLVNSAFPAEKKSSPVKSLIVIVSILSTLFFTVIVLIIAEQIKAYKSKN